MMKIKRQNKLMNYCAIPAGVLASAASVSGATVIFYGMDEANDTNDDPLGVSFAIETSFLQFRVIDYTYDSFPFFAIFSSVGYFTDGLSVTTSPPSGAGTNGRYGYRYGFLNGASAGDQNYANISFNGDDDTYEAVAQFSFDGVGGGYLVAIAFADNVVSYDSNDLSTIGGANTYDISAGKAAIDAASVPEPSSVALLALGATGLLMRRQRKAA